MEIIKTRAYHSDHRADDSFSPELMGQDVGRFENKWQGQHWIKYGEWLAAPREERFFKQPKLLVRKLLSNGRIVSYVDADNFYVDQQLYMGIMYSGSSHYSLYYLCSLCNTSIMSFIFVHRHRETGVAFPQLTVAAFNGFPIYAVGFDTPTAERLRYAKEGRGLYDQFCSKNDYASLSRFAVQHLGLGRTDVIHDLLAHLAERMIEMHKDKQEHQRAFRLDLAGYLDEKQMKKLNRLYTPKRPPGERVKNYEQRLNRYEEAVQLAQAQLGPLAGETLDLEDFWRLNQAQWQWVLRQNLGNVASMSALVGICERYRQQLGPLMRTIQRTDWLIDQVVYQLYGLTEEEIAIVEGRT
jgi:hypothetical protein